MDLAFVIPGHYISKDSTHSETKDVIRVLGEDPNRPNYFVIQNGNEKKSLHENTILDSYRYISTKENDGSRNLTNNSLFKDLDVAIHPQSQPIQQKQSLNSRTIPDTEPKLHIQETEVSRPVVTPQEKHQPAIHKSPDELFIEGLIDSVKSENQNTFSVKLQISTNIDFDKLRNIVGLLPNINKVQLINILYDTFDLDNIDFQAKNEISNYLFLDIPKLDNNNDATQTINESELEIPKIEELQPVQTDQSELEIEIENHLNNVDKYFKL